MRLHLELPFTAWKVNDVNLPHPRSCQEYTFDTHPVEAHINSGDWDYDLNYLTTTSGLASGDSADEVNQLIFDKTQSAELEITVKEIAKVNNKNWAIGLRYTKDEGAPTGDWCQGYTGYNCFIGGL